MVRPVNCPSALLFNQKARGVRHLPQCLLIAAIFLLLGPSTAVLRAQDDYLSAIGTPTFTTAVPVENGFINLANGNLHLEIPLGSWPQRGGREYKATLMYDSASVSDQGAEGTVPNYIGAGWHLATSGDGGFIEILDYEYFYCDYPYEDDAYRMDSKYAVYTEADGTSHTFKVDIRNYSPAGCNSLIEPEYTIYDPGGYSRDTSGYFLNLEETTGGMAMTLIAPDGRQGTKDTNGNYYSGTADTLGRILVTTSTNGNYIYYDVLDSRGSTRRFMVTTSTITINGESQTTISSIALPDGAGTYSFTYNDSSITILDGLLTSMTLPTGGTVSYAWSYQFEGWPSYYNSRTLTRTTSGGSWTYLRETDGSMACSGSSPAKWKATVTHPSGDKTVYMFTMNGGLWPTQVDYYNGSVDPSHLLASVTQTFNFSSPPYGGGVCSGGNTYHDSYIVKTSKTTTLPVPGGTSLKQTVEYSYDNGGSGGSSQFGNITQIREWKFYTGTQPGTPDRKTDITYLGGTNYVDKNISDRRASVTVTNGSGTVVAKTIYTYDGSSLMSATGKANHDDGNFGTSNNVRGNLTQVQQLVSGTSTYLTKSMTYDMTGQVRTETDWNGNTTTYDYTDNFFDDNGNGSNPVGHGSPSPSTNAYVKTVSQGGLTTTYGYYWGTGQKALVTDPNGQTTYFHFYDPLNRPTLTKLPNSGWTYTEYPNATHINAGTGITSTSFTTNCSASSGDCRSDETVLDNLGRVTSQVLVSDPDGQTKVDTQYDSNGRVLKTSNPYRSTSDATYGWETPIYDGLDRVKQLTHADGSNAYTYYGAAVTSSVGGRTAQVGSTSTYGYGYPVLSVDETGKLRQVWYDGFGRIIEVDEPASSTSAPAPGTGSATANGSEQSVTGNGQPGSGSVTISGSEQVWNYPGTPGTGSVTVSGSQGGGNVWDDCVDEDYHGECIGGWVWEDDDGTFSITVNGSTKSHNWWSSSTTSTSIATALRNAINADSNYPVTASGTGGTISLTAKQYGSNTNYSLSFSRSSIWGNSFTSSYKSGSTLTGGTSPVYDTGSVRITVNGYQATANYSQGSTASSVATSLRAALNQASSPVTASGTGATVTMTAKTGGASTNYTVTNTSWTNYTQYFSSSSFTASGPSGGALSGGVDGTTTYDAGTVWVTVNGVQTVVNYDQYSTTASVAGNLANAINSGNPYVSASVLNSSIALTARSAGSGTNYSLSSGSSTNLPGTFSQPSFTVSVSGGALTGGASGSTLNGSGAATATLYTYDLNNNLTGVTQGSQTRTFTYDMISRLLSANNPESGTTTYVYDQNASCPSPNSFSGQLVSKMDARGIRMCMQYDSLNRLMQKNYSDGTTPTAKYYYDSSDCLSLSPCYNVGRRTGMSEGTGSTPTTKWAYDPVGNIKRESRTINGVTRTITYAYNKDSSVASITYPSGHVVTYSVKGAQRATQAEDSSGSPTIVYATTAQYAPHGALKSLFNDSTNLLTTMHYNKRMQPCRISVKTSGSAPSDCGSLPGGTGNVMDLNYGFAANGNVLALNNNLNTTRSQTFTYDNLNRIATAAASTYSQSSANCWGESFSIDAYGNLTGISNLSSAYNGCQDTENLSVSISGTSNRISGYCYDAAGNLTGQTNCSSPTYAYDAENRLISTAGVTYTYDGDGKRVSKSTSGSAYKLYWTGTGSDPLEETDGSGNTTNEYIFFDGKRIARRNSSGNVFYYFADHLGTSRMIVQAGQTSACYDADFYPYGGERTPITNTCSQNYKFTGKERDGESGLDNFGARYNSSWMGRFMTPDEPFADQHPEDPQSWNLYAYVRNNPLAYVDPTGRACNALLGNTGGAYCQRATLYAALDAKVSAQTRFFAAASATSRFLASADSPRFCCQVSGETSAFLANVGKDLATMNSAAAFSIQSGSLSGPDLDAQMVHMDQTGLQSALDKLKGSDSTAYQNVIDEMNGKLNPGVIDRIKATTFGSDAAYMGIVDQVRKGLGRDIDFAKQSDREAIGNALIRHIRTTGGCDVNSRKGEDCQGQ